MATEVRYIYKLIQLCYVQHEMLANAPFYSCHNGQLTSMLTQPKAHYQLVISFQRQKNNTIHISRCNKKFSTDQTSLI